MKSIVKLSVRFVFIGFLLGILIAPIPKAVTGSGNDNGDGVVQEGIIAEIIAEKLSQVKERDTRLKANKYYNKGLKYFKKELYKKAIAEFTRVLEYEPDNSYAKRYIEESQNRLEKGRVEQLGTQYKRGVASFEKGRYEEAAAIFQELLRKEPDNINAQKYLDRALEQVSRNKQRRIARAEYVSSETIGASNNNNGIETARDLAQRIAEEKEARLKAKKQEITAHYNQGKQHYKSGKYDEAIQEFKNVLELDPTYSRAQKYIDKAEKKIEEAKKKERKNLYVEGSKKLKAKDYEGAIALFEKVLEQDSRHTDARRKLLNAKELQQGAKPRIGRAEYVEVEKKKEKPAKEPSVRRKVSSLMNKASEFRLEGQYDDAITKYTEAIAVDPDHIMARRGIVVTDQEKHRVQEEERAITVKDRIIKVREAWLPPTRPAEYAEGEVKEEEQEYISEAKRLLLERANKIIPEINFTNAHLRDVIQYLSKISGVNIILDESLMGFEEMGMIPTDVEIGEGAMTELEGGTITGGMDDRVTISLRNIPLIEALKYVLRTKGLEYMIEDYAIWISSSVEETDMVTRTYTLPTGGGMRATLSFADGEGRELGETGAEIIQEGSIRELLEETISFPPGSKMFLDPRTNILVVTNTVASHRVIEDVIASLSEAPIQVLIEAKFIDINYDDIMEFGIEFMFLDSASDLRGDGITMPTLPLIGAWDRSGGAPLVPFSGPDGIFDVGSDVPVADWWRGGTWTLFSDVTDPIFGQGADTVGVTGLGGVTAGLRFLANATGTEPLGNILSFSGILTEPQFKTILHALDQHTDADVISAPRVTTINNQQAVIEDVTEVIYPLEFELTPAETNDQGTVVSPAVLTVGDFQTREVGIILNVTPDIGADKKTINLTILPEVSSLTGWQAFGSFTILSFVPIFQTQNVNTSITINDGETVVLGGLISEQLTVTKDKLPFLGDIPYFGRFFRLEAEESEKRNLLIFVTANIITPTGEYFRDVAERETPQIPVPVEGGLVSVHN